jgi:ABC-type transport system involved in multi-copper enzyme maturation permease subunit
MNQVGVIAAFTLRESLRRRVFLVVALLTLAFLGLYGLGTWKLFDELDKNSLDTAGVELGVVAAATLLGLAMFATLFLGTVLAVFLTLGAVRGDAERGLLQPLLVRPVRRRTLLLGRFVAAASVCAGYVIVVFLATAVITRITGGWWPDRFVVPALGLAFGVAIIAAVSLAGSVFLSATANGIAVFMIFGAGLVAGLLGQIGEALGSDTLHNVAKVSSWLLPFEGLYQAALAGLTTDTVGFTKLAINLGPFGRAQAAGVGLWVWALVYLGLVGAWALRGFARRDL